MSHAVENWSSCHVKHCASNIFQRIRSGTWDNSMMLNFYQEEFVFGDEMFIKHTSATKIVVMSEVCL